MRWSRAVAEGEWAGPADQPRSARSVVRAVPFSEQIRNVEAGGVLISLGNSGSSEEPAGHIHPVPSALGPRPPPAAAWPGEGVGLSSDRWFGWVFSLTREPGGPLCACMSLARPCVGAPLQLCPCPPGRLPGPGRGHLVVKAPKSLVSALGFVVRLAGSFRMGGAVMPEDSLSWAVLCLVGSRWPPRAPPI